MTGQFGTHPIEGSFMAAQVVVVTGASGGIGRAVGTAYGARGASVALLARGEKGFAGAARVSAPAAAAPC